MKKTVSFLHLHQLEKKKLEEPNSTTFRYKQAAVELFVEICECCNNNFCYLHITVSAINT